MEEIRVAYNTVETYDDLLQRNIEYLNGNLKANPYTHSSIIDDNDMKPLLPKLIELTKLGYYSITGQPNKAFYNIYNDNKKMYISIEQRNYTSGLLQDDVARHLKHFLDHCKHKNNIYYRIDFDNDLGYYVESNMPYNNHNYFNLTRSYETNNSHNNNKDYSKWNESCNCWNDVNHRRNVFYQYKDYPKIMNIFLKCAGVYITTKDYNSKISVEDIMKEFLLSKENIKYKNALTNNIDTNELSIDELMKQFSLDDNNDNSNNNSNSNNNQKKKKNNKKK